MVFLMMHSTHLALDIWYRTIQIVRKKKPAVVTIWATFSLLQQGIVSMHNPIDRIVHILALVTPVVEQWLEH